MEKIYKIYFDGEKVVYKIQYHHYIEGDELRFIYERENEYDVVSSMQKNDLNQVLEYSLGDIVAYTFRKHKIEGLSVLVHYKIIEYHNKQIHRKQKEIDEHNDVLLKLFYLNDQ